MIDSVCWGGSVVVGGEVSSGLSGVPVVPEADDEDEEALRDAGAEAGHGVGAVVFERELAFEGVEDRLDPLADAAEVAEAGLFVSAVGAQEDRSEFAHEGLELFAGEAFVGDHGVALEVDPRSISAATSRSGALAGASSKAIGIPSEAHSRYRRKPQK